GCVRSHGSIRRYRTQGGVDRCCIDIRFVEEVIGVSANLELCVFAQKPYFGQSKSLGQTPVQVLIVRPVLAVAGNSGHWRGRRCGKGRSLNISRSWKELDSVAVKVRIGVLLENLVVGFLAETLLQACWPKLRVSAACEIHLAHRVIDRVPRETCVPIEDA